MAYFREIGVAVFQLANNFESRAIDRSDGKGNGAKNGFRAVETKAGVIVTGVLSGAIAEGSFPEKPDGLNGFFELQSLTDNRQIRRRTGHEKRPE